MFIFFCVNKARSFVAACVMALAACLAADAADAATGDATTVPESFTFRFAPAELAGPAGVDKLYDRLIHQARAACRGTETGRELWWIRALRECEAVLIDKVVTAIAAPVLQARHRQDRYHELARRLEDDAVENRTARRR